jgi:2-dehydro-3-deoxygluconokinase
LWRNHGALCPGRTRHPGRGTRLPRVDRRGRVQLRDRLGHSVCWVSRLGRDPFGSRVLKTLRGEGVDVSRVETDDLAPTGIMFKDPGLGNTARIFYYRRHSAAAALRAEPFESLKAKYLFVTGITPAVSESNRRLTFKLVDRFRASGTKVAFDPNMRFRLWGRKEARAVFLELVRRCDLLIPQFGGSRNPHRA